MLLNHIFQPYAISYRNFLGIAERQVQQQIEVGPDCFSVCDQALLVYQSIGYDYPFLCAPDGQFSEAISIVFDCMSASPDRGEISSAPPELNDALASCSSYCSGDCGQRSGTFSSTSISISTGISVDTKSWYSSLSSICSEAAKSNITLTEIICNTTPSTTSTTSAYLTLSISPTTSSVVTLPTETSPTPNRTQPPITTAAIAGIAVGAALGGIIIFALVLFFVWRHRKNRKRKRSEVPHDDPDDPREKAQLHNDEYVPHRSELPGAKVPRQVRVVGDLQEMEFVPSIAQNRAELNAAPSTTGDSSTLQASSDRTENKSV